MQLAFWSPNRPDGHQNDLVSIDGVVVTDIREAAQDEYVLESDGRLFTAIYRHPFSSGTLPAMLQIPLGSRIRVTGICMVADPKSVNPGDEVPFNILLRSFSDITVLANPSLLNVRNLLILVGVLLAIVFAVGARGWLLERRVRRQTTVLSVRTEAVAALEQRRSRILEDINGSRPLAEIIEEIAALASFKLNGAPCWCQIADGARLGAYPQESSSLRVIHEEIPARSGAPLGTIFAGLKAGSEPQANEREALAMSTGLATLAIETRRLYDDLMHRSEFDLLTDIHNRFSLDKYLDAQIEVARSNAHIFGLIYIDLDEFKQVNDIYGHKVGDLFLQEVAVRMKRQLRAHDMLARLGGDEFAVLLAVVRSRADVEEVALRLEHSLDEPFVADGYTMHGAASVGIAIYPEDATTKDGLLSSADAAMYVAKYTKRQSPPDSSTSVGSNPVPPVLRRSTSEGRQ
jgi:diguanylate cyclase (GGDEF)-like protein